MTTYLGKSCSFCLPRVPFVDCRQFMYLVISLLVLRAGYGIWLYQFLIIAYLFTLLYTFHYFSLNTPYLVIRSVFLIFAIYRSKVNTSLKNKICFENIYFFPLNLLSCVQKALKNIQTKFHWVRMKHKHFIEVSNICPTITLKCFHIYRFAYVSIYLHICKFTHVCKSVHVNRFTHVCKICSICKSFAFASFTFAPSQNQVQILVCIYASFTLMQILSYKRKVKFAYIRKFINCAT